MRFLGGLFVCASLFACSASNGTTGSDDDTPTGEREYSSSGKSESSSSSQSDSNSAMNEDSSSSLLLSSSSLESSSEGDSAARSFSFIEENDEMLLDLHKMEMTDKRDGQIYKVYARGYDFYLARNLNYATENSWCYNDYPENCNRFGRLYTWWAAKGPNRTLCNSDENVSICPKGWKMPSLMTSSLSHVYYGGYSDGEGGFYGVGAISRIWSSEAPPSYGDPKTCDPDNGYVIEDNVDSVNIDQVKMNRDFGASVRCYFEGVKPPDGVVFPKNDSIPLLEFPELTPYNGPYGEILDERDGNIYKTVKIGNQTWMTENLRYASDSSFCYDHNCEKYEYRGRFYELYNAMGLSNLNIKDSVVYPVQGVCPAGWHIPTAEEWNELFSYVAKETDGYYVREALYTYSHWNDSDAESTKDHAGMDAFGLNIYSAGSRSSVTYRYLRYVEHGHLSGHTYMMSSTPSSATHDYYVRFSSPEVDPWQSPTVDRTYYPNIRCVEGVGSRPVPAVQDSTAK